MRALIAQETPTIRAWAAEARRTGSGPRASCLRPRSLPAHAPSAHRRACRCRRTAPPPRRRKVQKQRGWVSATTWDTSTRPLSSSTTFSSAERPGKRPRWAEQTDASSLKHTSRYTSGRIWEMSSNVGRFGPEFGAQTRPTSATFGRLVGSLGNCSTTLVRQLRRSPGPPGVSLGSTWRATLLQLSGNFSLQIVGAAARRGHAQMTGRRCAFAPTAARVERGPTTGRARHAEARPITECSTSALASSPLLRSARPNGASSPAAQWTRTSSSLTAVAGTPAALLLDFATTFRKLGYGLIRRVLA